jgi:acyl-CoA reductase-like NAD-dependent aldehyde dehydrogenase
VNIKKPAYVALKTLGTDIVLQIDEKLIAGETGRMVADWLQKDGLLKDVKREALIRMIERYRGTEVREKLVKRIADAQTGKSLITVARRATALEELEEIARIQRKRVDKMLALEDGKPMLITATSNEIRMLKEILVDLGHMQLETGVIVRAPKTVKGVMTGRNGEEVAFSWTEEQAKLYQELEGVERSLAAR